MAETFDELVRRTTSKQTRRYAAQRTRELLTSEIQTLRGKSRREVARALAIRQPRLSKLQHQSDMQISTRRRAGSGGKIPEGAREDGSI